MRRRRAAGIVLAILGVGAGASSLRGQSGEAPRPGLRLERAGPALLRLTVRVPSGWTLYAPDLPAHPATGIGLPLQIRAEGEPVVPADWPTPTVSRTGAGPAWVHEAGELRALLPGRLGAAATLDVLWALCREALCVPGRTELEVPPG